VPRLLLLFDVDGTLLLSDDPLLGQAAADAAREAFGVEIAADALYRLDHAGRTALRQGRELLRRAGLPDREIDAGLGRWCALLAERYLELLTGADTSAWHAPDCAEETLAKLDRHARLALLTGNPEPIAYARMERLGLDRFFPRGQGAFGCESEERPHLVELARERAGGWPASATVAVGDTPVDVEGAHAAGIRVVAIESHRFDAIALAGADARIGALAVLPDALVSLHT
jgi:phosphoglycolate phosphatase-like HAD superfamily hydrolase